MAQTAKSKQDNILSKYPMLIDRSFDRERREYISMLDFDGLHGTLARTAMDPRMGKSMHFLLSSVLDTRERGYLDQDSKFFKVRTPQQLFAVLKAVLNGEKLELVLVEAPASNQD